MADPPAERKPANARRRDDPRWNRKTECMRRMVNITPYRAASGKYRAFLRIHVNIIHSRQIDDEPIVANAQPCGIVAAAANGHDQVVLAAKIDRRDDVRHIAATGDQAGPPIDHGVVDLSSRVVTRVALFDELSAEAGFEGGQ